MMHFGRYFGQYHRAKSAKDRLVMTILCRDEVDIIEANVRAHALLGVDAFVVMDNGSTDGTREKLDTLSQQFDMHIIDETGSYQQAKWMKRLAVYAREKMAADWVISNDADEFWLPKSGRLKDYLTHKDSVVTVHRSNMLLTKDALQTGYHFSQAEYKVQYPICYDRDVQKTDPNISMLMVPISPKVIVNPNGFIKISGGNHRAKHIGKALTARREPNIEVLHFPIRSYEQFEANIQNRQKLLKQNARMGDHYRRWVRLYEDGQLEKEFARLVTDEAELSVLETLGVAKRDVSASQVIRSALNIEDKA